MLSSVYLTGGNADLHLDPHAGSTSYQPDWRSFALTKLQRYGFKVVNPLEFAWSEPSLAEEVIPLLEFNENVDHRVQRSLELIDQCDAVLANLNRASYGTPMEIFYAYNRGKVVTVVGQPPFSPWVLSHSQARFGDVDHALDYIIDEQPHSQPVQWALQYEALLAERYEELPQPGEPDYKFMGGEMPVLVVAPHATAFFRDGEFQEADTFTGSMAAMLNRLSGCHALVTNYCCVADPMSYLETPYCRALADVVKAGQVGFVLVLLGAPWHELPGLQIQGLSEETQEYIGRLKMEMLSLDKASQSEFDPRLGHLPRFISEELKAPTLVLRMHKRYRMPRLQPALFLNLLESINRFLVQTGTELIRGR
jgi:hypothetical protein